MKANELLLWLSARKEGTWNQFRGAVESLHVPDDAPVQPEPGEDQDDEDVGQGRSLFPLYQRLRLNLQGLAHVEFRALGCDDGWRVAPPMIAIREDERLGWNGILCGARSPTLAVQLEQAMAGHLKAYNEEMEGAPALFRFEGNRSMLVKFAAQAGLHLQIDAPLAILSLLPSVSHRTMPRPANLPVGRDWQVKQFSPDTLAWTDASREEATSVREGLFRFHFRHQPMYFLCIRGVAHEMRHGQVGKYHLLLRRRKRILRYDAVAHQLSMPASCRPPLLVERALILFTGKLPTFDPKTKTLTYERIPSLAARIAAQLLGQEASL